MKKDFIGKKQFEYCDALAIVLGAALLILFLLSARLGFGVPDEPFYYTIPQRMLHGDRLLIEEWNVSQLSSLFSFVPYWIYTKITGSTEGIILYMRHVFIAIDLLFYAYMYIKLRRYGYMGLLSTFLFCSILPECNYAIDYFTVSSMIFMVICLIMITDTNEKGPGKLILVGVLFAFSVLAEPFLLFLYLIWFAVVLVWNFRNRKTGAWSAYGFLLHKRIWFWITLGSFVVFVLFMSFLYITGTLQALHITLPYLVTGEEYNKSNIIDFSKLFSAINLFGKVHIGGLLLCIAAAGICRSFKKTEQNDPFFNARTVVFALSVLFLISCFVTAGIRSVQSSNSTTTLGIIIDHELPIMLASLCWLLLCERIDRRMLCLWWAGTLFSVLIDISSAIMLTSGGRIVQTAGFISLGQFLSEHLVLFCQKNADSTPVRFRAHKTVFYGAVVSLAAFLLFWNVSYIGAEGFFKPMEYIYSSSKGDAYTTTMQTGPLKNIKTSERNAEIYAKSLRDADTIISKAEGQPVFFVQMHPYLYLYADLPYATFSSWDEEDDRSRHIEYWKLFENNRPRYAYVPYYYNFMLISSSYEQVKVLTEIADCTVINGEAGYIIEINGFKIF